MNNQELREFLDKLVAGYIIGVVLVIIYRLVTQ